MKNAMKTAALLAGLGALFMGVGVIVGGSTGLLIGLLLGLAFVGGSYWFSDTLAIKAARAVPATREQLPQVYAIVEDLTRRADMPMPRIYVSPEAQPNAFATGRSPDHAAVAVTQGILQVLDAEELRGVLAHELSHVKNRDILIGSVAAAVAMGIIWSTRIAFWFGGDGEGNVFGALLDDDPRSDRGRLSSRWRSRGRGSSKPTRVVRTCCTTVSRWRARSRRSRRTRSSAR